MAWWNHIKSNRVAATIIALVIICAFGTGAYALAQGSGAFDPSGFAGSQYEPHDDSFAYQSSVTDTDIAPTRSDDMTANDSKASKLDATNSGTTALNVVSGTQGQNSSAVGPVVNGDSSNTGSKPASKPVPGSKIDPAAKTYTLSVQMMNADGSIYYESLTQSTTDDSVTYSLSTLAATMAGRGKIGDAVFGGWSCDGALVGTTFTTSSQEATLQLAMSSASDYDASGNYNGSNPVYVAQVNELDFSTINNNTAVTVVYIPANVTSVTLGSKGAFTKLTEFIVNSDNAAYSATDGMLYTKDSDTLVCCPAAKTSVSQWPAGVKTVGANAFYGSQITSLDIPAGVSSIADGWAAKSAIQTLSLPATLSQVNAATIPASVTSLTMPSGVVLGEAALASDSARAVTLTGFSLPTLVSSESLNLGAATETGLPNVTITVPESMYELYLEEWGPTLDARYGAGSALKILNTTSGTQDGYVYDANGYHAVGATTLGTTDAQGNVYVGSAGKYVLKQVGSSCTDLNVKEGTVKVADGAALGNTTLKTVTLPDQVTGIGSNAFAGCTSLTSINLPDGIRSIGDEAFNGCTSLQSVTIPNACKQIGAKAFCGSAISGVLALPSGLQSIDNEAFAGTALTSVEMPSIQSLGDGVFSDCIHLKTVQLPDSLTAIPASNFAGCTSLTSVATGKIQTVGDNAFNGCSSLSSIDLSSVTTVGASAFAGCTSLDTAGSGLQILSVDASSSNLAAATSIGAYAFAGSSLQQADLSNAAQIGEGAFQGSSIKSVTLGANIQSVGASAFADCSSLKSVQVSGGAIGASAFADCTRLSSVDLGSVSSIGSSAFAGCTALTSVTIPSTAAASLGDNIFSGCTSLRSVALPDNMEYVPASTFAGCAKLTSVNLDAVTAIGSSAFQGCTSLGSLSYADGSIGDYAFAGCTGLASIDLEGTTAIGAYAFQGCTGLTQIDIPASAKADLGSGAFADCSGAQGVSLPQGITAVPDSLFSGCSSLTSVEIPGSVTAIGSSAFSGCSSLTTIAFSSAKPAELGSYAFGSIDNLLVTYPANAMKTYRDAWAKQIDEEYGDGAIDQLLGITYMPAKELVEGKDAANAVAAIYAAGLDVKLVDESGNEFLDEFKKPKTMDAISADGVEYIVKAVDQKAGTMLLKGTKITLTLQVKPATTVTEASATA